MTRALPEVSESACKRLLREVTRDVCQAGRLWIRRRLPLCSCRACSNLKAQPPRSGTSRAEGFCISLGLCSTEGFQHGM